MNTLDIVILVAAVAAGVGGWRLGFLARVASWIGLAIGIVVSARLLPAAIRTFGGPSPTSKLVIAAVVLIGGAFLGQAIGLLAGSALGRFLPLGPVRMLDRGVGTVVGALGIIVSIWLLLPSIAEVPGSPARMARESVIARFVDSHFPRPPNTLDALRRVVGESQFPQVFEGLRRAPITGPPPATTGLSPEALARVTAATVQVAGEACNRIQEGSGFSPATDTIITNAHVVAGETSTTVMRTDGRKLRATVVLFDSDRDLAILHVPNLGQTPLTLATGSVGTNGAVFGHPGGQPQLRIAPAAIRQQVEAVGRDLYGRHTTRRDVFILASDLHPGDSGGALADATGSVVGIAFAIAPDRPGTSYALTSTELRADLARPRGAAVSTGDCLTSG